MGESHRRKNPSDLALGNTPKEQTDEILEKVVHVRPTLANVVRIERVTLATAETDSG